MRSNWRLLAFAMSLTVILSLLAERANFASANFAVTESGVSLAKSIFVHGQKLLLAACGTRDALWSDILVAALYLSSPVDGAVLSDRDRTKAVRLTVSDETLLPNEMPQRYREALTTALTPRDLRNLVKRFTELSQHDTVWLTYAPRPGLSVIFSGETGLRVGNHRPVETILSVWGSDGAWISKIHNILSEHRF